MPANLSEVLAGLAAARDRALRLVGFVGDPPLAVGRRVEYLAAHPKGQVLSIPRSNTDQHGEGQLVVLPYAAKPQRRPGFRARRQARRQLRHVWPVFRTAYRNGVNIGPTAMTAAPAAGPSSAVWSRALDTSIAYRPLPASRVRHLCPPARRPRPGHPPPDGTSLAGQPRPYIRVENAGAVTRRRRPPESPPIGVRVDCR